MKYRHFAPTFFLLLALTVGMPVSRADEAAKKGRAVFEANKNAVVTVQLVLSISFGGQDRENASQANATVVDPSGLAVLSLMAVDPTALYENTRNQSEEVTSKIVSMKMVFADGAEIPCEVILRDKDLDLAFVRPTTPPAAPMPAVNLEQIGVPELLDEVVIIGQLGEVARRAHTVTVERIETIVEKPRTFYAVGEHRSQTVLCSPVFTLGGKFVGIGAMRAIKQTSERRSDNFLVVIVPAADIKEAAAQAPPVKAQ